MVNQTKQVLEESLKKLMLHKPLDKITIRDLTEDCGISRMAFYYHFKDIYDLVEWACLEDATRALAGKKTYDTWSEGLVQIFDAVYENKPFILKDYEVYDFLLKNWNSLKFSPPIKSEITEERKINPKRMQREINNQLQNKGMGTKAQQALKLQHEQNKMERKVKSKEQREAEKERQYALRQEKRKAKHRGDKL